MLTLLLLFTSIATGATGFDEAKALADKDETALSKAQADTLKSSLSEVGRIAFRKCMPLPLPDVVPPFTVVMELNATGKVKKTWPSNVSTFTKCIEGTFAVATLFKPPSTPFYTSFEFIFGSEP
jgi:hypothetical protein